MKKYLSLFDKTLQYELQEKDVKNINLRIRRDGTVVVSKPRNISQQQVEVFLQEKWNWIWKGIEKMSKTQRIQEKPTAIDAVRFLGRVYPLVEVNGSKRLAFRGDAIYFFTRQTSLDKKLKELQQLLEKQFVAYVEEKRQEYDVIVKDYGVKQPQLKYRYLKGKWGSCDTRKAVITMNYNLMYYPPAAIDYVLLHEYAHLVVPNHSKRFHDFLKYHMPNYKTYEELLKA